MNMLLTEEETSKKLLKTKNDTLLVKNIPAVSETVHRYACCLENADNAEKARIENELVNIGAEAVPALVETLHYSAGRTRGIIAMVLIRIGSAAVEYLKRTADADKNFKWIADYLTAEIQGAAA